MPVDFDKYFKELDKKLNDIENNINPRSDFDFIEKSLEAEIKRRKLKSAKEINFPAVCLGLITGTVAIFILICVILTFVHHINPSKELNVDSVPAIEQPVTPPQKTEKPL